MITHLKKFLAASIVVFLLIGVTIDPIIAATTVNTADDNDLVNVTIQLCDVSGENTQAVELTTRQVREIRQVFDELQHRLSTAQSLEETQSIVNDAVVHLWSFHLFPSDMSIEQAKKLVTRWCHHHNLKTALQAFVPHSLDNSEEGEIQNILCSIAGNTSNTHCAKLAKRITHRLFAIMDYSGYALLVKVATALWTVLIPFSTLSEWGLQQNGYRCGVSIYFGNYHYYPYPNWLSPAQGWLSTSGINGKQNISGSFWGQTMTGGWQPQDDWYMNNTWRGCMGFTGLITYIGNNTYYLGSALSVNIGPDRP